MLIRLGRALLLRCPNCGQTRIFSRWFRMVDTCPRCRHRFERQEGYWLGAIAINTVVTLAAIIAGLVIPAVVTWPDPPWGVISAIVVATSVLIPVAFYPLSKTLWVALELGMHPPDVN